MGTAGARVGFLCRAPAHLDKNGALVDHLTVHDRLWAYCPSNARAEGHDWKPTGGVPMAELEIVVRGMRERRSRGGNRADPP
jgi:hypothetical protein